MNRLKMLVRHDLFSNGLAVLLEHPTMGGMRSVATAITFEQVGQDKLIEPTFTIDMDTAQGLFNALWQEGFRPKDGSGNAGHIAAMQAHLDDMRRLVFEKPRIDTRHIGPDGKVAL